MSRQRLSYFAKHSDAAPGRLDELIEFQRGVLRDHIHLIASACYPFESVLHAMAQPSFVLPAEGMPGERYLPGAQVMDLVENEGERLVLDLFGCTSGYRATLQPHSGTQANQIVYNAVLKPEDTVLCLRPRDGGHISHTVLISRRHKSISYGLTEDGNIDYDRLRSLAVRHRPQLIIVGGSALPRAIDFATCAEIAREAGAYLHADVSHTATFIAAGLHPNAFPHCDFVTFNTVKNLRGPNGGVLIYRADFADRVGASVFPTTQGGANESSMLAKFAVFAEWKTQSITNYASDIVTAARIVGEALSGSGIRLVTGGTDCHILLLDLRSQDASGAEIEQTLENLGVLANRNLVPGDKRSPRQTSGLRIGATNLAILGYESADLIELGTWIAGVIATRGGSRETVDSLIEKYQGR